MLLLHVRFAREDAAKRGASLTVPELADTLRRLGYAVKIRTALGGGSGGACLRSLRHSFLTVSVAGPSGSLSYVLDPRFREQVRHGCADGPLGAPPLSRLCNACWPVAAVLLLLLAESSSCQNAQYSFVQATYPHLPLPTRPVALCSLRLRTPRRATRACWQRSAQRSSARRTA